MRQINLVGVLIRDVQPGSPAAEVGLQATEMIGYQQGRRIRYQIRYGDLIVGGDGQPITNLDDWFSFLERHKVGEEVVLSIVRGLRSSRERNVEVRLRLAEPR